MADLGTDAIPSPDTSRFAPPATLFAVSVEEGAERRRRAEKAEAVGHLAGGLAHDFNNLLNVILGNLERTSRLLPSDTKASKCVSDAMTATDRAVSLVRRLLAFVHRQPLVPQLVEVDRLLLALKPLLDVAAPGCAIVLDLGCAWQSLVDANQLENAVLNLVVNARDAMAGGGRLTIATRECGVGIGAGERACLPDDYVVLDVRDTGAGMSPEVQARATEPLFTTKASGAGTGLGLSQVAGFVSECGGAMQIASEPGKGTCVSLRIPRARTARAPIEHLSA